MPLHESKVMIRECARTALALAREDFLRDDDPSSSLVRTISRRLLTLLDQSDLPHILLPLDLGADVDASGSSSGPILSSSVEMISSSSRS